MESLNAVPIGRGRGGRGRGFRRTMPTLDQDTPSKPIQVLASNLQHQLQITEDVSSSSGVATDSRMPEMSPGSTTLSSVNAKDSSTSGRVVENLEKVGISGERCHCSLNFIKLKKTEDISVFQYQVSFVPSLESTKTKMAMVKQLEQVVGSISTFDGQSLYLPKKLPLDHIVINCKHPNCKSVPTEVTATIKFIKENIDSEEMTQFYNALFQRILLNQGYLEIRQGFYKISKVRELPWEKLQVWPGVLLTVGIKDGGLMVMFDTPNRVLRTETTYDAYQQLREMDPVNFREAFAAYVIGKIILCQYSKQCYKIDDVAWDLNPASDFHFKKRKITYWEYYKQRYDINIRDMEQPLLVSKIKPRNVNHPNPPTEGARVVALVPELCYLTGLTPEQRSNQKLMSEIRAITQLNPSLRISAMDEVIKDVAQSTESLEILANWGLRIDEEVLETIGRRISSPALCFDSLNGSKVVSDNFSREASRSCYHPIPITKFLVFCIGRDLDSARGFVVEYAEACSRLGIKLRTKGEIIKVDGNGECISPSLYVKALEESCINYANVQLVVVILPFYREDIYRAVKRFCLTAYPIPSQCIMSKTLRYRKIKKVAANICMQINCKLGGSPWGLKMSLLNKVMIIGMDAAHDPTRKNPSVIALVATLNAKSTVYFSRCSYQPIHQEVCTSLRIIFKDALNAYVKYNAGELPDRILFYRDGGSAGTFDVLKKYEIDVCLEVLQEDGERCNKIVEFSYICVAKRIPQRILLKAEGKRIINPPPGTVLDHTITSPSRYDFFIVSQRVYQGTVNPTHYSVLYETKRTKPDVMQKISYALTFMYYNWQGTIKVPSVIQYSHKLGQLVSRIQAMPNRTMSDRLYFL